MPDATDSGLFKLPVKVFGDRNTCTRLIRQALQSIDGLSLCGDGSYHSKSLNFVRSVEAQLGLRLEDDESNALIQTVSDVWDARRSPLHSWKHREVSFEKVFAVKGVHVVFAVKHPGAWLVSLFRKPYDRRNLDRHPTDFGAFLRGEWHAVRRERGPERYETPIEIWNRKTASYLEFSEVAKGTAARTLILQAEQITGFPQEAARRLDAYFDLPDGTIAFPSASTKDSAKDAGYYARYYGRELWREAFDDNDWAFVEAKVDWDVARRVGYAP